MARPQHTEYAMEQDRLAVFGFLDAIHGTKRIGLVVTGDGHAIMWAILTGVPWRYDPAEPIRVEFVADAPV